MIGPHMESQHSCLRSMTAQGDLGSRMAAPRSCVCDWTVIWLAAAAASCSAAAPPSIA